MFLNALIETDRLLIRPFQTEDLNEMYAVVSEKEFAKYIPEKEPTRQDIANNISWSIAQNKKNTPKKIYKFNLSIIHKKTQKLIGFCGLGADDLKLGDIELYYGISKYYQKQGLAFEACTALLKYGFETIGLTKIAIFVDQRNERSLKLAERLGATYRYKMVELKEEYKDFENYHYFTITDDEYFKRI